MSEAQFCLWLFVIWSNFDRASAETMAEMVAIPVAILGPKLFRYNGHCPAYAFLGEKSHDHRRRRDCALQGVSLCHAQHGRVLSEVEVDEL